MPASSSGQEGIPAANATVASRFRRLAPGRGGPGLLVAEPRSYGAGLRGPSPTLRQAIDRGARLATVECACHAIGVQGAHPAAAAPDFVTIAGRYRDWRLDWELEAISQVGHHRMARKPLAAAEIADLTAYIRDLDSGTDRDAR